MREIIFRGKRIDNCEWVYGSFCMDACEQFNGLCGVDGFIRLYDKAMGKMQMYEVDRESVGQFTGLTDKNGKRIFEGDILTDDWGKIFKVFFTTKSCSFMVRCEYTPNEWETGDYRIGEAWINTIRVIGNIHDNPEPPEVTP